MEGGVSTSGSVRRPCGPCLATRLVLAVAALLAGRCVVDPVDLTNRPCTSAGECIAGWRCDELQNRCVPEGTLSDGGIGTDGSTDSGAVDAGVVDAGVPDVGPVDSGVPDAGEPDSGADSGAADSGAADSGPAATLVVGYNFGDGTAQTVTIGEHDLVARTAETTSSLRVSPVAGGPLVPRTTAIAAVQLVPAADAATAQLLNHQLSVSGGGLLIEQGVTNGTYQVFTWHMETDVSLRRAFDVAVQGQVVTASSVSLEQYHWVRMGPLEAVVTDGVLTVELRHLSRDTSIAGLEVTSTTGGRVRDLPSSPGSAQPYGWFDDADATWVRGWVYDGDRGTAPTDLEVLVDGALLAKLTARVGRPDLVTAGVAPNPEHGFEFPLPTLEAGSHTVDLYAVDFPSGSRVALTGSPRTFVVAQPDPAVWHLVWADEFDAPGLPDPATWDYEEGALRNSELQTYTRARWENARVENGTLVLEARADGWQGHEITSASLMTLGKRAFRYGRIEVRAMLPFALGTAPAIWMLGTNYDQVGWPACGEIDVMVNLGFQATRTYYGVATQTYASGVGGETDVESVWASYHVYAIEWFADRVDFYVDDRKTFTFANEGTVAAWPFDQDQYLLLSLAFGGVWGGAQGVDMAALPVRLFVDYVRLYQLN